MTTVRLNEEIDSKITVLVDLEKTSKSEIIKKAILEYYDHHIGSRTAFELGKDLFGKYGDAEDLSSTYKKKLMDKLNEKHSH
ncbi:CopG family transcriptional regulator [Marispirochaeta sp.]|uniref:CopG family transcriptional regulator n=1 Tax=Marispirochaeta sp. TaxID=2038653 RepID=UPI0029C6650F|nr:CopG family transcriptional regulator [Marispirochaeta sp.]